MYSQAATGCTEGQFFNSTSGKCADCQRGCGACSNITDCYKCLPGNFFNETSLTVIPKVGMPPPPICVPCAVGNCSLCSLSVDTCQTCNPGFLYNPNLKACRPCLPSCEVCTGPLTCQKCLGNMAFVPNQNLTLPGKCVNCSSNCLSCKNETTCMQCEPKFFLTPENYCKGCQTNCEFCRNSTVCEKCAPNMYFHATQKVCVNCDQNCAACGLTGCLKCNLGFFLTVDGVCAACSKNCVACESGNTCNFCAKSFFFDKTSSACANCPANCLNCTSTTTCDFCLPGFNKDSKGACASCP